MHLLHPPGSLVLDGRTFRSVAVEHAGTVDARTRFDFLEDGDGVVADYAGGDVVRGRLVGRREGDRLEHRYVHLERNGVAASGSCSTRVVALDDGRLRLEETWEWSSRDGSGTGVLEETVELADDRLDVELAVPDHGVVLRPLRMSDAAAIADQSADPDIHRFTFITEPLTVELAQQRIGRAERFRRAGRGTRLCIVADREPVGETSIFLHPDRGTAELAYWLGPDHRGRGIGSGVLRTVVDWLTDDFDLTRLELFTHPDNVGSQRVATNAGFEPEGLLRNHLVIDGEPVDVAIYSLVSPD